MRGANSCDRLTNHDFHGAASSFASMMAGTFSMLDPAPVHCSIDRGTEAEPSYYRTDLSPEDIAYVNKEFELNPVLWDWWCTEFTYPSRQFDASLSPLAFNFVPDPLGALAGLKTYDSLWWPHLRSHVGLTAAAWTC